MIIFNEHLPVLLQVNDTAAPTSLMPSPSLFDVPYQSDQLMHRVSSICSSTLYRTKNHYSNSFLFFLNINVFSIGKARDLLE
jgi:hypothetical protein